MRFRVLRREWLTGSMELDALRGDGRKSFSLQKQQMKKIFHENEHSMEPVPQNRASLERFLGGGRGEEGEVRRDN